MPSQTSVASQVPSDARHVVPAADTASAGHDAALPEQFSTASQAPADGSADGQDQAGPGSARSIDARLGGVVRKGDEALSPRELRRILAELQAVVDKPADATLGEFTTLRTAAIAVGLAARPAAAWSLSAPNVLGELPGFWGVAVLQLVPGAVVIALLHVGLAVRHRRLCGCFA